MKLKGYTVTSMRYFRPMGVVDVNAVVIGIKESLQESLGREISLTVSTDPSCSVAFGCLGSLEKIISGIVGYAKHTMPNEGHLFISTSVATFDAEQVLACGVMQPGSYIQLKVRDTGRRLSEAEQSGLFDVTQMFKEPLREPRGLEVAAGLALPCGWYIDAHNDPTNGKNFAIYLPMPNPNEQLQFFTYMIPFANSSPVDGQNGCVGGTHENATQPTQKELAEDSPGFFVQIHPSQFADYEEATDTIRSLLEEMGEVKWLIPADPRPNTTEIEALLHEHFRLMHMIEPSVFPAKASATFIQGDWQQAKRLSSGLNVNRFSIWPARFIHSVNRMVYAAFAAGKLDSVLKPPIWSGDDFSHPFVVNRLVSANRLHLSMPACVPNEFHETAWRLILRLHEDILGAILWELVHRKIPTASPYRPLLDVYRRQAFPMMMDDNGKVVLFVA